MKLLIVFLVLINVLYAQNIKPEELDNLSLEELMDIKIYSATKSYQRVEEIPANITILTRKDIEKYNYTTLDELLKYVPGLFIIDDTEHFQIGSRGSLGSSFKLMINNNPISPLRVPRVGASNRTFFATPIQSIDRIEIIKGPQAVTYGSNSMYGSINIITNDFNEKNIISVSKGNNGQEKVFARINQAQENGGFTLNTSFYNTNGINGDLEDSFTKDYFDSRDPDAIKSLDGLLENEYKTANFSHRYKNLTTDITYYQTNYGFYLEPTYRDGNQVDQTEKSIALTYEDELNNKLSYKINFVNSEKNYNIDNFNIINDDSIIVTNHAKDKTTQLDIHLNYILNDKIKILFGASYEKLNYFYEGTYNTIASKRYYKYHTKDIYSKVQYKYSNKLEFNTGVRYTKRDNYRMYYEQDNDLSNPEYDTFVSLDVDKKADYLPEFSAIYHIDSKNHLKFLYGKANQLTYGSIDDFEEISSTEINYMYISNKYQINSSVFYNKATNISLFTQNGTNFPTTYIGDKITKGLEFALTHKASPSFESSYSITLQNTKHKMNNNEENYEADFSPKVLGKINLTYLQNKTRYSLMFYYISKMKASVNKSTNQRVGEDSNHYLDISGNIDYKIDKNLSLNFHITNIFDRDNRVPAGSTLTNFYNGVYTKGREFLFTLNYKF